VTSALLSPLVIPGVLVGVGLLFLSVQVSLVASLPVLLAAHTLMVLPFALRAVWTSLEQLDPTLERAAEVLGARPRQAFVYVILPLLRPGLVAALLFSLIMSVNEFAVSLFVVGRATQTLPVVLFNYTMAYVDPTIAAVSTLFVVGTLLAIGAVEMVVGLPRVLRLEEPR
jgi:putative spermidine/putrescine transport system permease protein